MTNEAKKKAKFRQSARWKNFRKHLKKTRKVDELTNKPLLKAFSVHHLDLNADNYQCLEEDRFSCLNRQSHDVIHFIYRYYTKDKAIIFRLKNILDKMCEINGEIENV